MAALTMPALVASYRKHVVETRLQKIYSVMRQAIKLSEVDNGERANWDPMPTDAAIVDWYATYLEPYLKTVKTETELARLGNGYQAVFAYLPDGSAVEIYASSSAFYPEAKSLKTVTNSSKSNAARGTKVFTFSAVRSGFGPYGSGVPREYQMVNNSGGKYYGVDYGCAQAGRYYCTGLISDNGWKIPDDYPLSF